MASVNPLLTQPTGEVNLKGSEVKLKQISSKTKMAQKFLDYDYLIEYCARNPDHDLQQVLAEMAEHSMPIVCGVGLDDIDDVIKDEDEELTPEQQEAALDLYAKRFDWVPCHDDLREAIDAVRAETNLDGGEKYV
jgi:hypothetical protein